jgi:hypothetical protein
MMVAERLTITLAALAVLAACSSKPDAQQATRDSSRGSSRDSSPGSLPSKAAVASTSDRWLVSADSVLRLALPHYYFGNEDRSLEGLRYCSDEGSDSPPMVMAAVRARAIAHGEPKDGTSDEGEKVRDVDFQVELTSIAQLTPAAAVGVGGDSIRAAGAQDREAYVAVVGLRTDTLTFSIRDYVGSAVGQRWAMCGLTGEVRDAASEFWSLIWREPNWMTVVRWTPADASWSRLKALADSVTKATR